MDHAGLTPQLIQRLSRIAGDAPRPIPLHAPEFGGSEWTLVKECLDSGWVSSVGKYVDRFEAEVAALSGTAHSVAVVNGTAALEIALRLVGVGPGDEVLMPTLTFVATANAAAHIGAVPHFVDSDYGTLGLDPVALGAYLDIVADLQKGQLINRQSGRRIAAVVPMHVFGHPVNMPALTELCVPLNLAIVEDAAESLGSRRNGTSCGAFGRVAAVSFNGNKIVTTGGGGAVVTNDAELARRAKHLTTTAKRQHRWAFEHDEAGFNYRLPNLNAALGCAQLEQLPGRLAAKRHLAERYAEVFADFPGGAIQVEPDDCRSNYWLNTLVLSPEAAEARDALLDATNDAGFMCRPVWQLMHRLPMYAGCPRAPLSVAEDLEARIISLPSSAMLGERLGSKQYPEATAV